MASLRQEKLGRRKMALLIGNNDYRRRENQLSSSRSNAEDMSTMLKSINVDVKIACDVDKHAMVGIIADFSRIIRDHELVLFYFCGHGCHIDGKNYLIPADDGHIETKRDVIDFAISVDSVLSRLVERNPSYATVMILDCFRSYTLSEASPIVEL